MSAIVTRPGHLVIAGADRPRCASVAPAAVVEFVAVGVGMSFGAGAQVGAQLVAIAGGMRWIWLVPS